jgi:hypothetical protein
VSANSVTLSVTHHRHDFLNDNDSPGKALYGNNNCLRTHKFCLGTEGRDVKAGGIYINH